MSGAVIQPNKPAASRRITRQPLLSSCAIAAALVAAGHTTPLCAQAFQAGNPTVALGSATRNITSATTETITVNTPTAVLNWVPNDAATGGGAINYLPSGNVATFQNGVSNSDFTILNRIIPVDTNRAVQFDGTILSRLVPPSGAPTNGGNVWFYSPGGIIVGSTAFFDVGSLILSANDIDFSDNNLFGPSGEIRFRGIADSRSSVTIQPGASPGINQISAPAEGSYVALVAPHINQGGNVRVNGSAAYVAAEAADITINGGLFNIQVTTGSHVDPATPGDNQTFSHTGSTTGPSPRDGDDFQSVYMVAMPKNDAITMLVSGTAGYQAVSAAGFENGSVILSAGYNIQGLPNSSGTNIASPDISYTAGPPSGKDASLTIAGGAYTSRVTAFAVTDAKASGTLDFDSALDLTAGRTAGLTANAGETVTIDGSMGVRSLNRNNTGVAAAGQAAIRALGGGTITVLGGATADASSGTGGIAGNALFEASGAGSKLDFGRESFVLANGLGGTSAPGQGGTGSVLVSGGTLTVGEQLVVTADGFGGDGNDGFDGPDGGNGGGGTGGTATVSVSGNGILEGRSAGSDQLLVSAAGSGGSGGGAFETGYGVSGNGGTGGAGTGGTATINIGAGTLRTFNTVQIDANGTGGGAGSSTSGTAGTGGNGTGGAATFLAQAGSTTTIGSLQVNSNGFGGSGTFGASSSQTTAGGAGRGGTADVAVGGAVTVDSLQVFAEGSGGDSFAGTASGEARGGTARTTVSGGVLTVNSSGTLSAVGTLGAGEGGSPADAFGGTAAFLVENSGSFQLGSVNSPGSFLIDASAQAVSTNGGLSGNATGGAASFTAVDTGATLEGSLTISADGTGGSSFSSGSGGNGNGGTASLVATGGNISVSSFLTMTASGQGGSTDEVGDGGMGQGGTVSILSEGGSLRGIITLASVGLDASGNGGDAEFGYGFGAGGGDGGAGIGGTASFEAVNGTITVDGFATLIAEGTGGSASNGGSGGNGTGGTAQVTSNGDADGTGLIEVVSGLQLDAMGEGGSSFENGYGSIPAAPGDGGSGTGGTAQLLANAGQIDAPLVDIFADGTGGSGSDSFLTTGTAGTGGAGTAGQILVGTGGGTLNLTALLLIARGQGGDGGFGSDDDAGGNGGSATGGSVTLRAGNSAFDLRPVGTTIDISATGGSGGGVSSGSGAGAAGGNGGNATGGTFTLATAGAGGALTVDSDTFSTTPPVEGDPPFSNDALAGSGGDGGDGTTGGRGGNGGNATGGTVELAANLGNLTVTGPASTVIAVTAVGGDGGTGGDSSTTGNTAGAGGDGGTGTGGTIRFKVAGGTVSLGDSELYAHGNGGFGGQGGTSASDPGDPAAVPPVPPTPSVQAGSGLDGDGFGGTVSILVGDDSTTGTAGAANFGSTFINPVGFINDGFIDFGGRAEISDNGTATPGGIHFTGLDVLQQGSSLSTDQATGQVFDLFSASRRIRVDGDAMLTLTGPAYFRASGSGGLDVGGTLTIDALLAQVTHDAQPATPVNTISAGDIIVTTDFDFSALADSRIASTNGISINSTFGGIGLNKTTAGTTVDLNAANSISAGSLDAGTVLITAGGAIDFSDIIASGPVTMTAADFILGGSIDAGSDIRITSSLDDITLTNATAGGTIDLDARNDIDAGTLDAAADIRLASALGGITLTGATADGVIDLDARGNIVGGTLNATGDIRIASALGGLTLPAATAGGAIDLDAPNSISLGTLSAGGDIEIDAGYEPSALDDDNVVANSNASVTAGDITSTGGEIDIEATASVSGGNLSAGHELSIAALNGGVSLASARAGTLNVAAGPGNRRAIGIAALGDVTITGNATAALDIGIVSGTGSIGVGSVNAGSNAVFLAANNVTLGPVTAPGRFSIANSSMLPTLGTGPDDYDASNLDGVTFDPTGGGVSISGAVDSGPVVIASGGQIGFNTITSSSFVNLGAGTSVTGAGIDAGGDVAIDAPSGITLATLSSGGNIGLTASSGAVLVSDDLGAAGLIDASGTSVTLNAIGNVNIHSAVASAGDVVLNSGGDLGVEVVNAPGSIALNSGGDMTINDVVSATNSVTIGANELLVTGTGQVRSDGTIDVQTVADSFIQAGGLIGAGAVPPPGTLSGVQLGGPADSVSINAGQSLFVDGTIRGLSIALSSADVAIGSGALIGDTQTTSLLLANNGTGPTSIGGTGSSGYSLSNPEFGRLQANSIDIFGPGSGTSSGSATDLVVRDLDVRGSQASSTTSGRQNLVGPNGSLRIGTGGSMRIEGNVAVTGAGTNDLLAFNAIDRINMITPAASVTVRDAQGGLAGTISMNAQRIFVGSDQAAQEIAALTDVDEIDARLGDNDGALKPEGYLQANSLSFSFDQALLIQNSGGPGRGSVDRAGFTAGTGGVSIDTGESSNAVIIINGRQTDGSGGFVGGKDLIPLLSINGQQSPTSGFDLRSTANGCLIVGLTCRFDLQPTVPPVQDVVDEVTPPENSANQDGTQVVQALNVPTIQFVDYAGMNFAPLIEEPVTGAGNDDFWTGEPQDQQESSKEKGKEGQ